MIKVNTILAINFIIEKQKTKHKYNIVLYLKSGIPAAQLIPAPVWTTTCFALFINEARILTLSATSAVLSNF